MKSVVSNAKVPRRLHQISPGLQSTQAMQISFVSTKKS